MFTGCEKPEVYSVRKFFTSAMFFLLYRHGFTVLNQVGRGIVRDLVIFGADADARASVFI
jgi:hypothetical protein